MPVRHVRNAASLAGLLLVSGWGNAQLPPADPLNSSPFPVREAQNSDNNSSHALPSLPWLFSLALTNNSELSRQRYESQARMQDVPMAQAGLKPHIDASTSYFYQRANNIYTANPNRYPDEIYDDRVLGTTNDTIWQVQLSQPVFSLERWRLIDKAEAQAEVAVLRVAIAERDLALEVVEVYLNAYLASRKLGLLDTKREALLLQRRQAQRAYDLGIGDRINLLESQSRLDQAIADLVKAENQLANALSDLERLTGRLPDFNGISLGNLEKVDIEHHWDNTQNWLSRASANLQVLLTKRMYQVAQLDSDVRRAAHFPEINLNFSYNDRNSSDELRASEEVNVNLELNIPLYQGGYTIASVRQAELNALAAREAMTNELRQAQQEVRKYLRSLHGDTRQLRALSRSIVSGELFLEAAIKGELLGVRDLVDVLDARAELYELRIRFVEGICQYLLDRTSLKAAVGNLNTGDLITIMSLLEKISHHDSGTSVLGKLKRKSEKS